MALSQAAREEIRGRMALLAGAEARAAAQELASSFGVSECTIYRTSRTHRRAGARANQGVRKVKIGGEVLDKMVSMSVKTGMPATDIIEVFEGNGLIDPGAVRPAWLSRHLKQIGFSRRQIIKDPRPCRRFEAGEPGELLQIDCTVAEQFYIDDDGSVGWEATCSRNKNRPGNMKKRLVLFAAIDDHSRSGYAEFMDGQTTNHWLNFLFNTFRKKDDPRFIFHGIPRAIYMDNDSVARNPKFVRALKDLGIALIKHRPTKKTDTFSNARSKGKVERFLGHMAGKQKRTKIAKLPTLAEANRFMFETCLQKNRTRHGSTGETPFQRWMKIRPEMLIQCEDERLYEVLYRDIIERQVGRDMTLRLDGDIWQLPCERPFLDMVGRRVTLYRHPLERDRIFVEWEGREYLVERRAQEMRAWADGPRSLPRTEREKEIGRHMETDLSHLKLWGFDQGPDPGITYLPMKEGVALDTSLIVPEKPKIKRISALLQVSGELGRPLRPAENEYLSGILGEWCTEEEIGAALENLLGQARAGARAG